MKNGEKGFTLVELIVGIAILFLVGGAGAVATFQLLKGTEEDGFGGVSST